MPTSTTQPAIAATSIQMLTPLTQAYIAEGLNKGMSFFEAFSYAVAMRAVVRRGIRFPARWNTPHSLAKDY